MEIDYKPIEKKLQSLMKKRIKDLGLVKTGRLLRSVKVTAGKDGDMKIEAEDYFEHLDEEHNISSYVLDSDEFIKFSEDEIAKQIEQQIDKTFK